MYRKITGACESCVRVFMDGLDNPPDSLTINTLIKLTDGQYGTDMLRKFYK